MNKILLSLFVCLIVKFAGLQAQIDTTFEFNEATYVYAQFHKTDSWREGNGELLCFDTDNNHFCPDSSDLGYRLRSYLSPAGLDSFAISLSLYSPLDATDEPRPTILYVHGGGLSPNNRDLKDTDETKDIAEFYTIKGYNFVAIDYRKGWESKDTELPGWVPGALGCYFNACTVEGDSDPANEYSFIQAQFKIVQDMLAAHRFLYTHAEELQIIQDQIFYFGISSGGIAALSAYFAENEDWNEILSPYYGNQDLNSFGGYQAVSDEISPAGIMTISSGVYDLDWVDADEIQEVPIFMIHGSTDKLVPYIRGNLLGITGYEGERERAEVFNLFGSKAIYDHIRTLDANNSQIRLSSLYGLDHQISKDINLSCPFYLQDEMYQFLNSIKNTGEMGNSYHQRFTNFGDSTLICRKRQNQIDFGQPSFNGGNIMYTIKSNDTSVVNPFQFEHEEPFSIEASIIPEYQGNKKTFLVSTRLPGFLDPLGYDLAINKNNKLVLKVIDRNGSYKYRSTNSLIEGECNHIAVSRSDSALTFYINGEVSGTFDHQNERLVNNFAMWVGNRFLKANAGYKGKIEYLRFWNASITDETIHHLKEEGRFATYPHPAMSAYYDFTENEGQQFTEYVHSSDLTSGWINVGSLGDPSWRSGAMACDYSERHTLQELIEESVDERISEDFEFRLESETNFYPNPFVDIISGRIDAKGLNRLDISISTLEGKVIMKDVYLNITSDFIDIEIETQDVASGFYIINVTANGQSVLTKKMIKF